MQKVIILLIYNNLKKNYKFPNFDNRGGNPIKVKEQIFEKQEKKLYRKILYGFITNSFQVVLLLRHKVWAVVTEARRREVSVWILILENKWKKKKRRSC